MNRLSRCIPSLGTYVEVTIAAELSDAELLEVSSRALEEIEKIQTAMSFHDEESELSRINRSAHKGPLDISQALSDVLTEAFKLSERSDGLFDVTVADQLVEQNSLPRHLPQPDPGSCWRDVVLEEGTIFFKRPLLMDLGGIAKGYAVDCALGELTDCASACVNAGGDLARSDWRDAQIGVRHPLLNGEVIPVAMRAQAMATSANYYNPDKSVMIDPQSRRSIDREESISVFAPNCMVADALTKVLFLKENRAILTDYQAQALIVAPSGQVEWVGEAA